MDIISRFILNVTLTALLTSGFTIAHADITCDEKNPLISIMEGGIVLIEGFEALSLKITRCDGPGLCAYDVISSGPDGKLKTLSYNLHIKNLCASIKRTERNSNTRFLNFPSSDFRNGYPKFSETTIILDITTPNEPFSSELHLTKKTFWGNPTDLPRESVNGVEFSAELTSVAISTYEFSIITKAN